MTSVEQSFAQYWKGVVGGVNLPKHALRDHTRAPEKEGFGNPLDVHNEKYSTC